MTTTTVRCRVCQDCYLYGYGGYRDRCEYSHVGDEQWQNISRALSPAAWIDDVPNCYDERYDEWWQEPSFSWDSCETCGLDLGGDRYKVDITYRTEARA